MSIFDDKKYQIISLCNKNTGTDKVAFEIIKPPFKGIIFEIVDFSPTETSLQKIDCNILLIPEKYKTDAFVKEFQPQFETLMKQIIKEISDEIITEKEQSSWVNRLKKFFKIIK